MLEGGHAHATFSAAVKDLPNRLRSVVPDGLPYSAWQIVEHIRIAQRDILDFSRNADGSYVPRKWPDSYWPDSPEPPSDNAWELAIREIVLDREAFEALLTDTSNADLTQPFPWGDGQNLLHEGFLIAAHTSYHTGELIVVRRLLSAWEK